MYKVYIVRKKDISNCTYNMVDLGLPSGTLWADRNVGATSPEDFGSYFQWGDTNAYTFDGVGEITAAQLAPLLQPIIGDTMKVTKDNVGDVLLILFEGYDVGTDLTNTPMGALGCSLDKVFDWNSYFDVDELTSWEEDEDGCRYPTDFKKYNKGESGLTVLESVDDAATVHMGSQYRMPTSDELLELQENTIQTFIDVDGNEYINTDNDDINIEYGKLKGVRFTGSNGNSIFIPAAGTCSESSFGDVGAYSSLWTSSLFTNTGAECFSFGCDGFLSSGYIYRN